MFLDCSEFPCMVLLDRRTVTEGRCDQLRAIAAQSTPPGDGIERDFVAIPATGGTDLGDLGELVEQRWESRKHVLAGWFARGRPQQPLLTEPPCAEVRATLDRLDQEPPCDVLREVQGCAPSKLFAVDPALVRAHVDAAEALVAELERTCPAFAERPHALDCADVPCVLAVDAPSGYHREPWLFCGHPVVEQVDTLTLQTHRRQRCDPTVIVPLWTAADLSASAASIEERYFSRRSFRLIEACQAVQAMRSAGPADDVWDEAVDNPTD